MTHTGRPSRTITTNPSLMRDSARKTLVLYRKRADEKSVGPRESHPGALPIKPFERGRVTTLWDLNWVFCLGRAGAARGRRVRGVAKRGERGDGSVVEPRSKAMEGQQKGVAVRKKHTKGASAQGPEPSGNGREAFHEVLDKGRGGERRAIWAALSRSKMIMGPPHCGHAHRELGGGVAARPSPFPALEG